MKEKIRNKGITLIVLVITIIILLILAGITIATLSNSGLFEKSKLAKEKWNNATRDEKGTLNEFSNAIDIANSRDTLLTDEQYLNVKILYELTDNNYVREVTLNENITNYDLILVDCTQNYKFQ